MLLLFLVKKVKDNLNYFQIILSLIYVIIILIPAY